LHRLAFFLGGRSYPNDRHVEQTVGALLSGMGIDFVTQREIEARVGAPRQGEDVTTRWTARWT